MRYAYEIDEVFKVRVKQDSDGVKFEFNELADAIEFASTCIETGDIGTEITIIKSKKED